MLEETTKIKPQQGAISIYILRKSKIALGMEFSNIFFSELKKKVFNGKREIKAV